MMKQRNPMTREVNKQVPTAVIPRDRLSSSPFSLSGPGSVVVPLSVAAAVHNNYYSKVIIIMLIILCSYCNKI